jgi:acyl carrier protein phosphodiesterase
MNFLAHLALSAHDEDEMVGNLLGDFTKFIDVDFLPAAMQRGVRLHRSIDRFTDFHPVFCTSKDRVHEDRWRFAGVYVDVYYDHFLSLNFLRLCNRNVDDFIAHAHAALARRRRHLPENLAPILDRMISENWLGCYATLDGLELTFARISRRLSRPTALADGVIDLRANYEALAGDFEKFWPLLVEHVEQSRNESVTSVQSVVSSTSPAI